MLTPLFVLASVVFLDILLSGDNCVVIGMAANTLPEKQQNPAIVFGMTLAAVTRIILSLFAISLLKYRALSIIGGLALLWVVYKLVRDILANKEQGEEKKVKAVRSFWSTIGIIAVADISMSLDNILAVAGLARNNPVILVIGLVCSIACVGFGAKLLTKMLTKFPWLNWVGVALITVVAFELIFGIKAI